MFWKNSSVNCFRKKSAPISEPQSHFNNMNKIWKIVKANEKHIPFIAANMRKEDKRELAAGSGNAPFDALANSLGCSLLAWTCLMENRPAFMWGVCPWHKPDFHGIPWLLATVQISRISFEFVKQSRQYVQCMLQPFPYLENFVHAKNETSMRWLEWCGFELDRRPMKLGVGNETFYRFRMNKTEARQPEQ